MKLPRATFIRICWKVGTVDYFTPQAWADLVKADPGAAAEAVSITRQRKAYRIDNGFRVPVSYTARN